MGEKTKTTTGLPKYQQVAIEIAERIVEGRYHIGEKIHARSTLATHFNVSPETARKAINVLVDLQIMDVKHGSGAFVSSKEKAHDFVEQYKGIQTIQMIREDMKESIQRSKEEAERQYQLLNDLVRQMKQVHDQLPFVPYEIFLTSEARNLEVSIKDLNFWHQTGGTIIAIQTDTETIISPGPYAKLSAGNRVFFVGSEVVYQRVSNFFYTNESR
ncbi:MULTISPECIES: GntR family transcriptional regulator [Enterococcus]|uniref:GntR family transcriptional regulator n=1 Tax=Enterococcus sulfureus ATCC 49903 TaxID=1140003 RepID=S0KQ80_9ENTE|nr:GntR family transcriptional regulator [Enterococcus sulfureus]EOT46944.1 hypothetical protein OMY_01194 [Enterococcus sulfureus ATCC 49903]EOT83761.1 hypothetical protein I573_01486 [Enterococcus sulfureus ATCC 49903]